MAATREYFWQCCLLWKRRQAEWEFLVSGGHTPLEPYMLQTNLNFCTQNLKSMNAPWNFSSSIHISAVISSVYYWWCYYIVWQAKIHVGTMLVSQRLLTQLAYIGATKPDDLNFCLRLLPHVFGDFLRMLHLVSRWLSMPYHLGCGWVGE